MRGFYGLALAAATSFISQSLAVPVVVKQDSAKKLVITKHNTLNGTHVPSPAEQNNKPVNAGEPLVISLTNNFGGGELFSYVTAKDPSGAVVMLQADGNWYFPDPAGSAEPIEVEADIAIPLNGQGESTDVTVPDYLTSGRVWVSEGKLKFFTVVNGDGLPQLVEPAVANPDDPSAGVNWGFVELTNTEEAGIWANISFVDFVGLILGMKLTLGNGETQTVQGLSGDALPKICAGLEAQSAEDGQPWGDMCVKDADGNPLRAMAPNMYDSLNPEAQEGYYDEYIEKVWEKYSSEDLTINTQGEAGEVKCRVEGDEIKCDGDNRGYFKPKVVDIWGCNSGPFTVEEGDNAVHEAIVPRMCAAFHRSTLLMDGGNVQPGLGAEAYYTENPTSHYSRLVHENEVDGLGYAFSYDDVNPDGENAAGVVSGPDPKVLEVVIGGFASNGTAVGRRAARPASKLTKLSVAM